VQRRRDLVLHGVYLEEKGNRRTKKQASPVVAASVLVLERITSMQVRSKL